MLWVVLWKGVHGLGRGKVGVVVEDVVGRSNV